MFELSNERIRFNRYSKAPQLESELSCTSTNTFVASKALVDAIKPNKSNIGIKCTMQRINGELVCMLYTEAQEVFGANWKQSDVTTWFQDDMSLTENQRHES